MDASQLPQPYYTENVALAITLYICGLKFTTHEGVTLPGFNLYSRDFLKSKGCEGKSIEVAIKELWNKGISGKVVYCFERTPDLKPITEGWDEQANAIQGAGDDAPTYHVEQSPETIARICCQYARTRKDFLGDVRAGIVPFWRRRDKVGNLFIPACKAIEGASRTEDLGNRKTVTYGSMKLQSVKV